jgi:MFS superfamily sulfate permease-like transporter
MRVFGLVMLALAGYYAWFYVARHEPFTLIQLGVMLAASALLLAWPAGRRRWPALRGRDWLLGVAGLALAVAFVMAMDQGSHSVSDTLNRAVPTLSLWLALGVRLRLN